MAHHTVETLVKRFTKQTSTLTIPISLVKALGGDFEASFFLGQVIHWSELAPDGWFAKSHKDWQAELFLSRTKVERITEKLKSIVIEGQPLLETKLAKSAHHGYAPVLHYRYHRACLEKLLLLPPTAPKTPNDPEGDTSKGGKPTRHTNRKQGRFKTCKKTKPTGFLSRGQLVFTHFTR